MADDLLKFDFGFTAVDESELDAVQEVANKATSASTEAKNLEEKLNNLYNAIQPLLSNLKQNPEKEYILWPNRIAVIEKFESHLADIVYK